MFIKYCKKDISSGLSAFEGTSAARFRERLKEPAPATWLFTGDSITHGCRHTRGLRSYCEYVEWHIKNTEGRQNDVFINSAVSGSTTKHALKYNIAELYRFKPDFLFVMYGTNDCNPAKNVCVEEFAQNLEKYVQTALLKGAQVVLQAPQPCSRDRLLIPYLKVIKNISEKYDILFIDHHETWKKCKANGDYMSDKIHPNAYGHLLYAKTIARRLMPADGPLINLAPASLPCKDLSQSSLTAQLLNDAAYAELVRSDKPFLTLCALKDDVYITCRCEIMRAQEDLRYRMFNHGENSMMRFFVNVRPEDLPRYITEFSPSAIVTEDERGIISIRTL